MSCGFNQRRGGRFCCQVNVFIAVSGIAGVALGKGAAVIGPLVVTVADGSLLARSFANRCARWDSRSRLFLTSKRPEPGCRSNALPRSICSMASACSCRAWRRTKNRSNAHKALLLPKLINFTANGRVSDETV